MISQRLVRSAVVGRKNIGAKVSAPSVSTISGFGDLSSSFRAISSSSPLSVPSWATADPKAMGVDPNPHAVKNLVDGNWDGSTAESICIPHPLDVNAPPIFTIPNTQVSELGPFFESLRKVPKSGLHNPIKRPERYVQYGEISRQVRIIYGGWVDNIGMNYCVISFLMFRLSISHFLPSRSMNF